MTTSTTSSASRASRADASLNVKANNRQLLEAKCWKCHTHDFAAAALKDSDAIKAEGARIVDAGRAIVRDLYADGHPQAIVRFALDDKGMPLLNATGRAIATSAKSRASCSSCSSSPRRRPTGARSTFRRTIVHWHGNADLWAKYLAIRGEAHSPAVGARGNGVPIEQFEQDLVARKAGLRDVCLHQSDRARVG